jgi:hypothetical protein
MPNNSAHQAKLGPTEHLESRNNLVANCSFVPSLLRTIRVGIKVAHPSIIGPCYVALDIGHWGLGILIVTAS